MTRARARSKQHQKRRACVSGDDRKLKAQGCLAIFVGSTHAHLTARTPARTPARTGTPSAARAHLLPQRIHAARGLRRTRRCAPTVRLGPCHRLPELHRAPPPTAAAAAAAAAIGAAAALLARRGGEAPGRALRQCRRQLDRRRRLRRHGRLHSSEGFGAGRGGALGGRVAGLLRTQGLGFSAALAFGLGQDALPVL